MRKFVFGSMYVGVSVLVFSRLVSCAEANEAKKVKEPLADTSVESSAAENPCEDLPAFCPQHYDPHVCKLEGSDLVEKSYNRCAAMVALKKKACEKGIQVDESKIQCQRVKTESD